MSPEFAQNGPIESEWNCWVEKNTLKMTRNRQNRPKKGRFLGVFWTKYKYWLTPPR